ncbi:hypothetical protein TYRP_002633 [Tyrophagus putrescentiae]|nr:hypothetical protein TYRP_002633 [Tyrophagus putrescentiae]
MDERLFSEYITFTTKIIGTKKSSSGETKLQLQWHPKGFYEDEWIKKCDLEFYRSRTVPRSVLPKSFLQALDEAQSSASQAAASVINGKSTVSKNTANKNIIKAKNLGSNKSTAKRSHSLNRNGRTAALGAEESESDDGAAANTAASPPQRPKRLRRQP